MARTKATAMIRDRVKIMDGVRDIPNPNRVSVRVRATVRFRVRVRVRARVKVRVRVVWSWLRSGIGSRLGIG